MKFRGMNYFVYGTLKRGFGNNRVLGDSVYCGNAITDGFLYESGIPFFVPNQEDIITYGSLDYEESKIQYHKYQDNTYENSYKNVVHGEIFQVKDENTWRSLDNLEGYFSEDIERNLYFRCLYPVSTNMGCIPVWLYGIKDVKNRANLRLNPTGTYK